MKVKVRMITYLLLYVIRKYATHTVFQLAAYNSHKICDYHGMLDISAGHIRYLNIIHDNTCFLF